MCWRATQTSKERARSTVFDEAHHMTCLLSTIWSLSLHLFGPAMIGPTGFRSSPAAAFLGIAMVQNTRNDDLPWSHTHIQKTCDLIAGNLHCKSQSHHPGSACHHVLHPLASNHLKRFGLLDHRNIQPQQTRKAPPALMKFHPTIKASTRTLHHFSRLSSP